MRLGAMGNCSTSTLKIGCLERILGIRTRNFLGCKLIFFYLYIEMMRMLLLEAFGLDEG